MTAPSLSIDRPERVTALAHELEPRDRWSRDQLLAYQRDRLEALLRHAAAASPYYREALGPSPEAHWLEQLPILTKAALMEQFDRIVTDPALSRAGLEGTVADGGRALYRGEYRVFATSGTTGESGLFVYSREEFAQWAAVVLHVLEQAGVRPEARLAAIGAPSPLHISRGLIESSARARPGPTPTLHATTPLPELVETLHEFRPEAIVTYSSIAGLLAEQQLEGALQIAPETAVVTGEVLTEQAERHIRDAWGIAPTQLYASTEVPAIACARQGEPALVVREDHVIVEVVDEENRPLPPGALGHKVLVTNLVNRALPLIRYELSDAVELAEGHGAPGMPFRRIARVDGRSDDILRFPGTSGRGEVLVHPHVLRAAFTTFHQVRQYQLDHDERRLHAVVVLNGSAAPDTPSRIRAALRSALERTGAVPPAIEVEQVERIDREPGHGAKLKLVRSRGAAACPSLAGVGSHSS
jgi:putative adenylate-forming enzyme